MRFKLEENELKPHDFHIIDTKYYNTSVLNSEDVNLMLTISHLLNDTYNDGIEEGYEDGRRNYDPSY